MASTSVGTMLFSKVKQWVSSPLKAIGEPGTQLTLAELSTPESVVRYRHHCDRFARVLKKSSERRIPKNPAIMASRLMERCLKFTIKMIDREK